MLYMAYLASRSSPIELRIQNNTRMFPIRSHLHYGGIISSMKLHECIDLKLSGEQLLP